MSSDLTCTICKTTHRSAQALWKHKLLHTGEKIKCSNFSTCAYASVYIADVRVHEARCGRSVDEKDWECECGSQFTMKQNWQKHSRKNPTHQLIRKYKSMPIPSHKRSQDNLKANLKQKERNGSQSSEIQRS